MRETIHPASMGRVLVIASRSPIDKMLEEQTGRPIAALLTSYDTVEDRPELATIIRSLLNRGCDYFVCFGAASEALHDLVDELAAQDVSDAGQTVMTTWHDEEPAAEVAEFFFDVAAARDRCLLVAVLGPDDDEMAAALVRQAAV